MIDGRTLLIRADGDAHIGTGHLMRCLALSQAWQDKGGRIVFGVTDIEPALVDRLRSEGMEVEHIPGPKESADNALQTADLAKQLGAPLVVDGYHFGAEYQRIIKDAGVTLLFVDDNGHADHYYADLVLNQNVYANESFYSSREPHTRLLLGCDYSLLRREFTCCCGHERAIPDVARKVLVTLGGSDPDNITLRVVHALKMAASDDLEAVVIVGASYPYYDDLQSAIGDCQPAIRLERNVTNMPELMAWADIAICAGGSTCWELAFMGLPNVLMILADNQERVAAGLEAHGVALNLGWHTTVSDDDIADALCRLMNASELRQEMSNRGRRLVDGRGAERVAAAIMEIG